MMISCTVYELSRRNISTEAVADRYKKNTDLFWNSRMRLTSEKPVEVGMSQAASSEIATAIKRLKAEYSISQ